MFHGPARWEEAGQGKQGEMRVINLSGRTHACTETHTPEMSVSDVAGDEYHAGYQDKQSLGDQETGPETQKVKITSQGPGHVTPLPPSEGHKQLN